MKCFVILCNDYLLPAFDNVSQHTNKIMGKELICKSFLIGLVQIKNQDKKITVESQIFAL